MSGASKPQRRANGKRPDIVPDDDVVWVPVSRVLIEALMGQWSGPMRIKIDIDADGKTGSMRGAPVGPEE